MRHLSAAFLCLSLIGPAALAGAANGPAVRWGSYSSLLSVEKNRGGTHSFTASWVSGTLTVRRTVGYSLRFRGGSVRVGSRALKPGCVSGKLTQGTVVTFRGATRVDLQVPSHGCPPSP
ncbi:hypothetical protein L1280_000306 [Deinococcus sp. HSC-46F16]|uniref:hypothetical protein n=1 Tax=Deinococcus sp. HSC-46F16 TaxID=2910968 RepID=UPI00209CCB43|nr:hypothetical protein [Deinococcus sp. HSC-46F16]MCP2013178.1 hypothetical protein [Deinococcus sp. HSC-46F16]